MGSRSGWLIALVAAALGVAALLIFLPRDGLWTASGNRPIVVGSAADPFSYDGTHVVAGEGTIDLWVDSGSARGELDAAVRTSERAGIALLSSPQTASTVSLRSGELVLQTVDAAVHGDTGHGGSELPETHAWIAGTGTFDLYLDGKLVGEDLPGRWLVADAVRNEDGAVRRGGLVYSPLLRDKAGFSDPDRLEATVFVTVGDGDSQGSVELYVVFADVSLTSARLSER